MKTVNDIWSITVYIKTEGKKTEQITFDFVEPQNFNPELILKGYAKQFQQICEDANIQIDCAFHNEISGSYCVLYSFYNSENKFIKH